MKKQNIENKSIKDYYNENIASFQNEEKRLIDVLSFSNIDNKSEKRIQEIKSNPKIFNEEISSRGLKIDDITLGFINKSTPKDDENIMELFDKENIGDLWAL